MNRPFSEGSVSHLLPFLREILRYLFPLRRESDDPSFFRALRTLTGRGLRTAGVLTIVLTVVYVGGKALVGGEAIQLSPVRALQGGEVLIPDKVLLVATGLVTWMAGRTEPALSRGRLLGAGIGLAVGGLSLYSDLLRGELSASYLSTVLVAVAILIPFQPWQILLLGGLFTGMAVAAGPLIRPLLGLTRLQMAASGQVVHLVLLTLLMASISAVLYRSRLDQHRSRRRAERLTEKLARLEEAKTKFFANISHELRTPLTLIQSPVQDALAGHYGPVSDGLQKRLSAMESQSKRLQDLVDQLLDLAKIDEGRMDLSARPLPAERTVSALTDRFQVEADRQGIRLTHEVDPSTRLVADADAIDKIVSNLIENALQYTPEGGTVAVRVYPVPEDAPDASHTRIAVRNTGPGIPEPVQQTLFQRYASAGAGEHTLDTGIGLALVRDLVDRHAGSVSVCDEDDVTEFAVDLPADVSALPPEDRADTKPGNSPLTSAEPPSAGRSAYRAAPDGPVPEADAPPRDDAVGSSTEPIVSGREERSPASGSAMPPRSGDKAADDEDAPRVLVVDDEADLRDYLRDTLEPHYRVSTAADANAALEAARASRPDLIISDVRMPGPTGFELCEAVRNDNALRAIPVVLLTVEPRATGQFRGLSSGADAYVSKPFDPQSLRQRIENLIDIRQFLRSRSGAPDRHEDTSGEAGPSENGGAHGEARGPADDSDGSQAAANSFESTVRQVVESEIDNSSFGVAWLADEVGLSRRQLQRKIQDETGLSAAAYIRTVRLQHAAVLLEQEEVTTVSGAAEAVGYRDPSHFSRIFREAYGISPSDYAGADHT